MRALSNNFFKYIIFSSMSWNPRLFDWLSGTHTGMCIFEMVEARENILIVYKTKLSRHRTTWKEYLIRFLNRGTTAVSKYQPSENHELTSPWGQLKWQTYRICACVLPRHRVFPPYDKWHTHKNKDRRKQWPSLGGTGSLEIKSTYNKPLPKLLYPRN